MDFFDDETNRRSYVCKFHCQVINLLNEHSVCPGSWCSNVFIYLFMNNDFAPTKCIDESAYVRS
jgi:hypothetical protein